MDWLLQTDVALFRWINGTGIHPALDQAFSLISDVDSLLGFMAAATIALAIWGGFKGRTLIVLMILCLLIGDAGINWSIKRLANRPRPHQTLEDVRRVKRETLTTYHVEWSKPERFKYGRSMTSGHTSNNVALALLITLIYGRWGALAWIWALIMGYSRIYTGNHYPSDILASFLVASAYTGIIGCAASRVWHKVAPAWFPQIYDRHPRLFA